MYTFQGLTSISRCLILHRLKIGILAGSDSDPERGPRLTWLFLSSSVWIQSIGSWDNKS